MKMSQFLGLGAEGAILTAYNFLHRARVYVQFIVANEEAYTLGPCVRYEDEYVIQHILSALGPGAQYLRIVYPNKVTQGRSRDRDLHMVWGPDMQLVAACIPRPGNPRQHPIGP